MKNTDLLDLYSDYQISSFGPVTATGLSTLVGGSVSHDQVTRSLAGETRTAAELWRLAKPFVRQVQSAEGVMIGADSIAEKPSSDEHEIIGWHYDHTTGQVVKGSNFMTALYDSREVALPVSFTLIAKTEQYVNKPDGKTKRRSPISKNEYYRQMLQQAVDNQMPFGYVLNDVWDASAENMRCIKLDLHKDFVMPVKSNRKVAVSQADQAQGQFVRVDTLPLEPNVTYRLYLEGVPFPLLLVKHVFTHEECPVPHAARAGSPYGLRHRMCSQGIRYLVSSDTTLTPDGMTTLYRKRWPVEPYHKSLKPNASLEKSPAHTVVTQTNHFFAALCSYLKLELLKVSTKTNHFALKTKLYCNAFQSAFTTLRELQPVRLGA